MAAVGVVLIGRRFYNVPVNPDEWAPPELREAVDPRRGAGLEAAAEVRRERVRVEAHAASRLAERLERTKREIQVSLVGASDFRRFQAASLLADIDRMLADARADVLRLSKAAYGQADELGAGQVDAAVRAVQITTVTSVGLSPRLVDHAYDNTAELLTEPMQRFRTMVSSTVRRLALNGDGFAGGMAALARDIGSAGFDAAAFKAERIVRTELGRTFNAATFDRMVSLADRVPAMRKIWLRAHDTRTRPTHVQAAEFYQRGRGIPVAALFRVGSASMRFPIDPLAAPAGKIAARETIMCRCNAAVDFDPAELQKSATDRLRLVMRGGDPVVEPAPLALVKPKKEPKPKKDQDADDAFRKVSKLDAKYRPAKAKAVADYQQLSNDEIGQYGSVLALKENRHPDLKNPTPDVIALFEKLLSETRVKMSASLTMIAKIEDQWRAATLNALAVPAADRGRSKLRFTDTLDRMIFSKIGQRTMTAAIRAAEKLVATKRLGSVVGELDGRTVTIRQARKADGSPTSRSFARAATTFGSNEIHMGTRDAGVVVHEMGHILDQGSLLEKTAAFLRERAGTDTTSTMRELTGNDSFEAHERAWPDDFADPYMGKDYRIGERHYATEILSMGLEAFYRDGGLELARKDPWYFKFVYDAVRGRDTTGYGLKKRGDKP